MSVVNTNYKRNFTLSKSEASIRSRIFEYFLQQGYHQINELELTFKRGSVWSSFLHINASKWRCKVKVIIKGMGATTEVMAEYNVFPFDNYTEAGGKFWEAKADELEMALNNTGYVPVNADTFSKRANKQVIGIFITTIVGVVVFFFGFLGIGMLVSIVFGLDTGISTIIGLVIGAVIGFYICPIMWKKFVKSNRDAKVD